MKKAIIGAGAGASSWSWGLALRLRNGAGQRRRERPATLCSFVGRFAQLFTKE